MRPAPRVKAAEDITVTQEDIAHRTFVVVGGITVRIRKTTVFNVEPAPDRVNEQLRQEGAGLGADAVIPVRYGKVGMSALSWESLHGKGGAVQFAD